MNRNVLKIIALITMIIDHVGKVFFDGIEIFRIIGRLALPIFAFFVAEGFYYTKNRKKYVLTMLAFTLISWLPFCLAFDLPFYKSNIIGIFLLSILGMYLFEKLRQNKKVWTFWVSFIILYLTVVLVLDFAEIIPEGIFGVLLPLMFFVFREKPVAKFCSASIVLVLMSSIAFLDGVQGLVDFRQFFSLLALVLIFFYNGEKGKANLKYLFYIGYPAHLSIIYIFSVLVL